MTHNIVPDPRRSIRRHLVAGVTLVVLLAGGVGGWAATTELSGAVIAPGNLVVETNVKKVQHPTGGVVGELRVRDGTPVKAGDVVVRLDDTVTRANLAIVVKSLDELAARQARLEAERDAASAPSFPAELLARRSDPDVARLIAGEQKLFETRRSARQGQKAQLKERVGGERGSVVSTIAQTKGKITETELQILQIDQDLRTEVSKDLAEIRAKTSELVEKKVAAEDQLKRVDIRAPQDGMVHQLAVHTVGGVITAGAEPIMLIVPEADALTVEARIQPQDIDQVRVGQKAVLRF